MAQLLNHLLIEIFQHSLEYWSDWVIEKFIYTLPVSLWVQG